MEKKSYFVIQKKKESYLYPENMFYFEDIDDALEAFRYLAKSEKAVEIDYEYINSKQFHFEKCNPSFQLVQETVVVYSTEEIENERKIEEQKEAEAAADAEKGENEK